MDSKQKPEGILQKKLEEAEETIEEAMWQAVKDSNYKKELETYEQVKAILISLSDLPPDIEKERDRILSYCLMRIDNALVNLGDTEKAVKRTQEALAVAEKSKSAVQIARCALAYGTRLLDEGKLPQAEEQFTRVIKMADKLPDNTDMQQVLAWTLIVRGGILLGKSLYNQAIYLLEEAEQICKSIDNYAGIAQANQLMARAYFNLDDSENAEWYEKKAKEYQEKAKAEKK